MKKLALGTVVCVLALASCTKGPGVGGRARINGKVFATNLGANLSVAKDSGYIANEDVFISYGNNLTIGDNRKTGIDGSYSFDYMRPGTYKVWTLSKVLFGVDKLDSVVVQTVVVDGKQDVFVPDLRIYTDKN